MALYLQVGIVRFSEPFIAIVGPLCVLSSVCWFLQPFASSNAIGAELRAVDLLSIPIKGAIALWTSPNLRCALSVENQEHPHHERLSHIAHKGDPRPVVPDNHVFDVN